MWLYIVLNINELICLLAKRVCPTLQLSRLHAYNSYTTNVWRKII